MKYLIAIMVITFSFAKALVYTIDDLKVLHSDKSFAEYIQHALDIRPVQRDEQWKSMTKEMAYGLLESLTKKKIFLRNDHNLIHKIDKLSFLKDDHVFNMKKGILFASRLNHCKSKCEYYLTEYLRYRKYYKESDLEIYYKYKDKYEEAKLLLTKVTTGENADIYCKRDKVKYYFENFIRDQYTTLASNHKEYISSKCIKSMKEHLINMVVSSKNDNFSEFVTNMLIKSEVIDQQDEDFLLTLFVLGNPSKGKLFNSAWTRIENLSEDYKRRKKVLERLTSLDPLPDRILESHAKRKRIAVINHFNRFFPEYFSEYSKVCVKFLEGQGDFPLGNPTVHCDKYFQMSDKKQWINDSLKTRYSSAKKL